MDKTKSENPDQDCPACAAPASVEAACEMTEYWNFNLEQDGDESLVELTTIRNSMPAQDDTRFFCSECDVHWDSVISYARAKKEVEKRDK